MVGFARAGHYLSGGTGASKLLGWKTVASIHVAAATSAAGLTGSILGFVGSALGEARSGLVVATGLLAVALALLDFSGVVTIRVPQRNRETSIRWLNRSQIYWAVLNGSAIGNGMSTRVGYLAWYIVPISSLLSGAPLTGALIYGLYGFSRAALALPVGLHSIRRGTSPGDMALSFSKNADVLSNVLLFVAGVAALVRFGPLLA